MLLGGDEIIEIAACSGSYEATCPVCNRSLKLGTLKHYHRVAIDKRLDSISNKAMGKGLGIMAVVGVAGWVLTMFVVSLIKLFGGE